MKVVTQLSRIASLVAMVFIVPMMVLITADVFSRYVLNKPIIGTAELSAKMMVCIFLGSAACALSGKQIDMDFLVTRLNKKWQRIVDSIGLTIGAAVVTVMIWQVFVTSLGQLERKAWASQSVHLLEFPFYWVLDVALIILLIAMCAMIFSKIKEGRQK